jgi:indole-3-glycerol phosphate synthase
MRKADGLPDILQDIVAGKREELRHQRQSLPLEAMKERAEHMPAPKGLARALREARERPCLIAEVKMASPSAGVLIDDETRAHLPLVYARSGATAISVLTERDHFHGCLQHLVDTRSLLQSHLGQAAPPLLRKDFLFEPYHVWQSKAAGADAILLIAAVLSDDQLDAMLSLSRDLGLDCLVEAHEAREVERALGAGAEIIGINNRDLRTFEVDLATTERLRPLIPRDQLVVAESGVRCRADVQRLADCGVDAVLVGEALTRADDPAVKMRELLA